MVLWFSCATQEIISSLTSTVSLYKKDFHVICYFKFFFSSVSKAAVSHCRVVDNIKQRQHSGGFDESNDLKMLLLVASDLIHYIFWDYVMQVFYINSCGKLHLFVTCIYVARLLQFWEVPLTEDSMIFW